MGETLGVCALTTANEKILSEAQKNLMCKDIQKIILTAEEKSKILIKNYQVITRNLAEKLLQVGTMTEKDIKQFFESENSKNTKTSTLAPTN
jgi:ATP-dependent Zn protease